MSVVSTPQSGYPPGHVAIIMDGNGRWANRRARPRAYGHIRGVSRIKPIVDYASKSGIRVLTLYAFSTENWNRPQAELSVLWRLLKKFLQREIDALDRNGIRLKVIGEVWRLGSDVRDVLLPAIERLSKNSGLVLCFAVSYGSKREIATAVSKILDVISVENRRPSIEEMENLVSNHLWTSDLGSDSNVDLLIRTSGEKRLSNFLLWQSAYAELSFLDVLWPDFSVDHFKQCLSDYGKRERRFGEVGIQRS
jgi:undecaprenyl diphosphate synthase